jgi:hypothetical protein
MQVPAFIFDGMLWSALVGVALGAVYLLVVLVREWKSGQLW